MPRLLFHHHQPQLALELVEFRRRRIARARDLDQEIALDRSRPVGHHDDAVGQVDRLLDAVGDEQDRLFELGPQAQQFVLQVAPGERVERAEGFVHQQDRRIERQHARDRHPLAHAAGQVLRVAGAKVGQRQQLEQVVHPAVDLRSAHALDLEAEADVLLDRHPGKQRVFLEHHAALRPRPGDRAAVDQDRARGRWREAGHRIEQGRLAAAGRAEQAGELPARDLQVDVLQGHHFMVFGAEHLIDAFDADMDVVHVSAPGRGASAADSCSADSHRCRSTGPARRC